MTEILDFRAILAKSPESQRHTIAFFGIKQLAEIVADFELPFYIGNPRTREYRVYSRGWLNVVCSGDFTTCATFLLDYDVSFACNVDIVRERLAAFCSR